MSKLMMTRSSMALLITLISAGCGGGKGCAYTSNPNAGRDIYKENIDINLGVIDGSHVQDGRIIIQTSIPDDARRQFQTFFDRAAQQDGFDPRLPALASVRLVRKSEANLPFGYPDVKDWTEYFCSDLRLFHIKDGKSSYLGAQKSVPLYVQNLRGSNGTRSEEIGGVPVTRYDMRDVFPDFYEADFDV